MSYTLDTIYDLRSGCVNEGCRSTLNMDAEQLWNYRENIMALMEALGLGRGYRKQLANAKSVSKKLASPYTIDIMEIP
jgi:hypothetical protein